MRLHLRCDGPATEQAIDDPLRSPPLARWSGSPEPDERQHRSAGERDHATGHGHLQQGQEQGEPAGHDGTPWPPGQQGDRTDEAGGHEGLKMIDGAL